MSEMQFSLQLTCFLYLICFLSFFWGGGGCSGLFISGLRAEPISMAKGFLGMTGGDSNSKRLAYTIPGFNSG